MAFFGNANFFVILAFPARFFVYLIHSLINNRKGLNMRRNEDYSVYLVTNEAVAAKRGRTTEQVVLAAVAGGVTAVQIREKELSRPQLAQLVSRVKPFTRAAGVPLIVNDSVETALQVGADGAHVGQSDLPAIIARRRLGSSLIMGVSVYNVDQALRAEAAGADYLGVAPIYGTKTKRDALPPMGVDNLAMICRAVSIPIIGIGGIVHNNADQLVRFGLDGVAVISAIIDQPDIAQAARSLAAIVRSAKANIGRNRIAV